MTRNQELQAQAKRILDEEGEEGGLCIDHLIKMAYWVDANPPKKMINWDTFWEHVCDLENDYRATIETLIEDIITRSMTE